MLRIGLIMMEKTFNDAQSEIRILSLRPIEIIAQLVLAGSFFDYVRYE